MSEPWDAEDLAIARALDAAPESETQSADPELVDIYREVLAQLPSPTVAAPLELEDRIVGAALRRRPAAVPALDGARARRDRRTRRVRLVALATTAVAAAIIVGLIVVAGGSGSSAPSGHVTLATAHGADIDALLRAPGTRMGAFGTTPGRVAIGRDGNGFVFDLAGTDPVNIGLVNGADTTVIGPARAVGGAIGFVVDHPERVSAITLRRGDGEIYRAELKPS
jgi:hypothetical protein